MLIGRQKIFMFLWLLPIIITASLLGMVVFYDSQPSPFSLKENHNNNLSQENLSSVIEVPKRSPVEPEITLMAVGDIMLSRHVEEKMFHNQDYTLPFSDLWDKLMIAHITFGNLESPFYDKGPRITEGMSFKAEPEAIEGLELAGFDVLSLANNHSLNQGAAGLDYTIDYLKQKGLVTIGAGKDFTTAHKPAVITTEDQTTFGFLAYSYASHNDITGGNNVVAGLDLRKANKDIKDLEKKADIIIVSMHAGTEYTHQPNWQQKEFVRGVIDAGADLVIGHHPHWVQKVEQYQNGWIFYSLGNFVFDQEWSRETKEGVILKVVWQDKKIKLLKLIPVVIENYSTPRLANQAESSKILKDIGLDSGIVYKK